MKVGNLALSTFNVSGEGWAGKASLLSSGCRWLWFQRISKQGKWIEMGELITDEILEEFAVVTEPGKVAGAVKERWGGSVDRITCTFPFAGAVNTGWNFAGMLYDLSVISCQEYVG